MSEITSILFDATDLFGSVAALTIAVVAALTIAVVGFEIGRRWFALGKDRLGKDK